MPGLKQVINEAHRRSLWQVLAIYAGASWLVFEVVQTLTEGLRLPEWFPAFALVLLLVGVPIVVATAFVQEGVGATQSEAEPSARGGRDPVEPGPAPEEGSLRHVFTWRNALLAGLAGFALWGIVATGWLLLVARSGPEATAAYPAPAIAVLPFENNSEDPEVEPLVNGIHDDLLTHLFQIGGLRVISRTSVAGYANTTKTIPQIAAELGATAVLEGGVQLAGDQIRINAQLIDAESDEHLWAESYDREYSVNGILALQSDVAARIADALKLSLTPEARRAIRERPTENTEAYEHYLRGLGVAGQSAATEDLSLYPIFEREFRRAVELDPEFGLAHAWLSVTHSVYWYWAGDRAGTRLADARRHAERALKLAPHRSEAHLAMAFTLLNEGDLDNALEHAERAIQLEPGDAQALFYLGLIYYERAELEEAFQAFRESSNNNPRSVLAADYAFRAASYTRRWDEARRYLDRMQDLPLADRRRLSVYVRHPIGLVLDRDGDIPAAQKILEGAREEMTLTPAEVGLVLSTYPELIWNGRFDTVLSSTGPQAADSARRCDCWAARAVWHERNGRAEEARQVWAAWAKEREGARPAEQPAEYEGPWRSFQALLLARAGRPEAARREMKTAWALEVSPLSRMLMRQDRLRLRATLNDVEGVLEDLESLLSGPSVLTPNEARTDPLLEPYRDNGRFQAILKRTESRETN